MRFSSVELAHSLNKKGTLAFVKESVNEIVAFLRKEAKSGDVILIMSNGGFGGLYQNLLDVLNKESE